MEKRFDRQARNESLMRTVNDQIAALDELSEWADPGHQFEFQCECGKTSGCDARLQMTLTEYEVIRSQRDRFAVVPGHETADIEHVVEENDRYSIVDKRDEVEHLVQ